MQLGINLSRSTVRTFKHNDMDDLERVLQVSCSLTPGTGPRLVLASLSLRHLWINACAGGSAC